MSDCGGKVTLIFSQMADDWTKEPLLNVLAAWGTGSNMTHCEIAVGEGVDRRGIVNVLRIYNDAVGVELISRTGLSPRNSYIHLGCSRAAEARMLAFARAVVGRPFSNAGMFRSILWPRVTDNKSFFCAELVAACLKEGGLLSQTVNPGAATPASLHKLFKANGACTANPFVLARARECQAGERVQSGEDPVDATDYTRRVAASLAQSARGPVSRERVGSLHVITSQPVVASVPQQLNLTLNSLDMRHCSQRDANHARVPYTFARS